MAAESYTLREAAELLGMSKRTLQRRIQEGAFPGRFLASGRNGLETRIPSEDVKNALEELRRRGHSSWARPSSDSPVRPEVAKRLGTNVTVTPGRELESLIPYETPELVSGAASSVVSVPAAAVPAGPSALTQSDLESLRETMLAMVREDREMFLGAVREALMVRDREIVSLRREVTGMRRAVEAVRGGLESMERRLATARDQTQTLDVQLWADVLGASLAPSKPMVDVDSILKELGELESMIVALDRDGP